MYRLIFYITDCPKICHSWLRPWVDTTSQIQLKNTHGDFLPEHVSGAWAADLPLSTQAYFCDTRYALRSRSAASRSTLSSRSSVFWNVRSPLRCCSPRFLPAPRHFRSTQRSHALLLRTPRRSVVCCGAWNRACPKQPQARFHYLFICSETTIIIAVTSCVGGRHNMSRPLQVDLWPFDPESSVRVTCHVGYIYIPIFSS